jgi:hypothetical protein
MKIIEKVFPVAGQRFQGGLHVLKIRISTILKPNLEIYLLFLFKRFSKGGKGFSHIFISVR